jgi:hypothetical protein
VKLEGRTLLPVVALRLEVEMSEADFFPFLLSSLSEVRRTPRAASAPRP